MFFPRRMEPLDLAPDRLLGLRLSLNSPVVQAQDLAVGPARAAIVVHEETDGRANVTIAVRALRSGEVVLYSYEGDLRADSSLAVGVDAALSFGESMGFLFDDDEIEGRAPSARLAAHARLNGWIDGRPARAAESARDEEPGPDAAQAAAPDEEAASDDELLLEETVERPGADGLRAGPEETAAEAREPAGGGAPAPAASRAPRTPAPPAPEAPRVLSKFRAPRPEPPSARRRGEASPSAPSRKRGSQRALGRVRLVKRRADGSPAPDGRSSFLLRLLGLF